MRGVGLVERREDWMNIDFIDVFRAYFHTDEVGTLYVQRSGQSGKCSRLASAMHGAFAEAL